MLAVHVPDVAYCIFGHFSFCTTLYFFFLDKIAHRRAKFGYMTNDDYMGVQLEDTPRNWKRRKPIQQHDHAAESSLVSKLDAVTGRLSRRSNLHSSSASHEKAWSKMESCLQLKRSMMKICYMYEWNAGNYSIY